VTSGGPIAAELAQVPAVATAAQAVDWPGVVCSRTALRPASVVGSRNHRADRPSQHGSRSMCCD